MLPQMGGFSIVTDSQVLHLQRRRSLGGSAGPDPGHLAVGLGLSTGDAAVERLLGALCCVNSLQ